MAHVTVVTLSPTMIAFTVFNLLLWALILVALLRVAGVFELVRLGRHRWRRRPP